MSAGFIIDEENQLRVVRNNDFPPQPPAIKLVAKIISYIFHPVFVPMYIVLFMVYVHPWIFAGFSGMEKTKTVMMAALMYTFFPVITVLLLKALKFINTFNLTTQKDRIIPLVACGIWYFWIWYVWRNLPEYPQSAIQLALAIWISASLGLMANIIMKVSLHAISMGVMLTFFFLLAFTQSLNFGIYLSIALFITGLVCSARFIASDHEPKEIYGGLVVGMVSMLVAGWLG
jgi:hypothetical protein